MARSTLPKNERLCREKAISRLFTEGRSGFAHPFRYFWLESDAAAVRSGASDDAPPEAGESSIALPDDVPAGGALSAETRTRTARVSVLFSVPKKQFKRAVKRNLLKRRTREAYRLNKNLLAEAAVAKGKHIDLALVYASKELSDFKTIENGVKRILEKIGKGL